MFDRLNQIIPTVSHRATSPIISFNAAVEEDIRVAQFFKLLSFQHADGGNNFCLRVYLDAIGPRAEGSQAMKAADSVQMQMVGSFWERLFRCKDEGKLRAMVQLFLVCNIWPPVVCFLSFFLQASCSRAGRRRPDIRVQGADIGRSIAAGFLQSRTHGAARGASDAEIVWRGFRPPKYICLIYLVTYHTLHLKLIRWIL